MGTSSARRAPSGRYWRRAKTALGRCAATGAATPRVAEVVAQYSAALCFEPPEASRELLAALADTAANLTQFYHLWGTQGWQAALAGFGFSGSNPPNPGVLWLRLVERLAGAGASLAQAAARAALVAHFTAHLDLEASCEQLLLFLPQQERITRLVVDYLGRFLATSLQADLGEILEYRAPEAQTARFCQMALQEEILNRLHSLAATILPAPLPASPEFFLQSCQTLIALLARGAKHE